LDIRKDNRTGASYQMTPKISFAITTHNEGEYIQRLLDQLIPHCRATGDEIVIVDDYSTDERTNEILADAIRHGVTVRVHPLERDFSRHKNYLNGLCNGEYIFQVDADETLHSDLLESLHDILDLNQNIDLFAIPRVNTVEGLTDEDIKRWGWRVNEKGWVMFPDYQTRLYRNHPDIKWVGQVHERISGYKTSTPLPSEEWCSLYHGKTIERQRKQNDFYSTLGG
jgi:glycosyltransferase involved in cell wall biosynthesis